ncbi:hypothetical protein OOK27_50450 [Streptomyces canus]|uniref:DUF6603 domain-containing protein n=1 Tax=Streptomyces canus TaxID=58343 RepID=UPI00225A2FE2|nr:DUF6603 domain-containing protein [Streptomyces canus]MCX5262259.1 hypothetical protein [Streptomyces canus]
MTAVRAEGLVGDLLEALGVTRDGSLDGAFLSDTGRTLKGVLHDARRRGRLLAVVQGVLTEAGLDLGPAQTVDDRDWLPLVGPELGASASGRTDHLDLSVVLDHLAAERTVVGLGVRYTHTAPADRPRVALHAVVPLVAVPLSGAAVLAPGTTFGDVHLDVSLEPGTEGGAIDVEALRAVMLVPTDGARAPHVVVTAEGLRLGDAEPIDLKLDAADPLVDQALQVGATLLRGLAESANPRLGALLRMIGLGADGVVPPLPLADLVASGRVAFWSWLSSLAAPAAARGWADALADLLSEHAVVEGDGTPERPARVRLPVGQATFEVALLLGAAADGSPVLTPRVAVDVDTPAAAALPRLLGRVEIDIVALRLGAVPEATAVPGLRLFGRAGPDSPRGAAPALVQQAAPVAVVIGSLSAGIALDADRRLVPLLAAHEVVVGSGARQVVRERVDLTDAQAVADLGAATLDALVEQALTGLGAGDQVRAALSLLGLRDPHDRGGVGEPAWPHRVNLAVLLADPLGALAASMAGVVAAGDLPVLLAELGWLLPRPNAAVNVRAGPVPGSGTADDPWRIALDDDPTADVELTCTAEAGTAGVPHRLTLGLRAAPAAIGVPGVGALALEVDGGLCTLTLPTAAGGRPAAELATSLAVRARIEGPLLLGDPLLGIRADVLTAELRWTPADGLRVTGSAPALVLDVGGLELPLDLAAPEPQWPSLEALAGYALRSAGSPVLRALGDLLGWGLGDGSDGPGVPAHLALDSLVADPVGALLDWLRSLAGDGDAAVMLSPLVAWLAALLGDLLEDDDPADAALRGIGTPADPWALRLRAAGATALAAAAGGARGAELLLWCEPEGPDVPLGSDLTGVALPSWLELGVGEDGDPPSPTDLAALLAQAATVLPGLGDVVRGRSDLATSLAALRDRLTDGDGLLPAAGATPARWTASTLAGVDHAGLQAAWEDDALDPATALFVTGPLGDPARWPLFDPARLIDLTAPGLPPAAFDLAAIDGPGPWFVALPARGAARVDPTAPDDGFDELVARLRTCVEAVRAQAGGPLTVIAHSTAGLPARLLAATMAGGIGRLITLGTPLDGATVSFADLRPTADAVHVLRAIWLAAGIEPGSAELPADLRAGAGLVGTLDTLLRTDPLPPAEFAAPTAWPSEAASVTRESVTGALAATDVADGIVQAVRAALHGGLSALGALPPLVTTADDSEEPGRPAVTALATGVRHDLPSAPDERGIAVTVRTTISGPRLGTRVPGEGEEPLELPGLQPPAVELRVALRREAGWLVGGPLPETGIPPAARPPRLRWAELVLASELHPGGRATVTIVLHEAEALGVERVAWPLRLTDDGAATLPAEARVLLFRLASSLGTTDDGGPLPATGAARALAEVLQALGIATLDDAGHVGLVAEAVERFLVAPGTALRESVGGGPGGAPRRRQLARALRVLAGVASPQDLTPRTATDAPGPARVDVTIDGLRLLLDLDPLSSGAAATLDVAAVLSLAGVLTFSGNCRMELVDASPRVSGSARLEAAAPASDLPYLALELPPGGAAALSAGLDLAPDVPAGWLPRRLPLWPPPDTAGDVVPELARLALACAPAALARLGITALRGALNGTTAGTALDRVLRALGLLGDADSDGIAHVRLPVALVVDPAAALRAALDLTTPGGTAGRAAAELMDAARALAGLGTAATPTGHLPLPYGLDLAVVGDPTAGGLTVSLGTAAPTPAAGAVVEVAAGVRIEFDPATGTRAQGRLTADVALRPADAPAALAVLRLVAEDVVRFDLVLPGPPEHILPLVPAGPGLGELVGEAAVRLLPTVLDAVVTEAGEIGAVVAAIGDALGLRADASAGRRFDAATLGTLAEDPSAALLERLRDHVGDVVGALSDLADLVLAPLPVGVVVTPAADGTRLQVVIAERVTLALARSGSGAGTGVRLDVTAEAPVRVEGIPFGSVRGTVAVDQHGLALVSGGASLDGDLLAILGVPLRPWLDARYAPAERAPTGAETPTSRPTVRAGLVVPEAPGGPVAATDLRVVAATVSPGQELTVGVVDGTGAPVGDDPGLAIARVLTPLVVGIGTEAAQDLLDTTVGAGPGTIGEVLDGVILRRTGTGSTARWAPVPDVLDPDALLGRVVALGGNLLNAFTPTLSVGPLAVTGDANLVGNAATLRVRLGVVAGETWWLVDAGDIRIGLEVATEWAGIAAADGGLELSLTVDPTHSEPVRGVTVSVRGATIRLAGQQGEDLLDLGVRLRSVAFSAAFVPVPPTLFGGRLALDRLAVPLGGAGGAGGNGVAAKVLDADATGGSAGGSGDTQKPAPALSPELVLLSRAGDPVTVDLRMGDGEGPWWLPLQAHLGPVYIEQFGFGVTRSGGTVTRLRLLVDGGVSIAGLTAQVDDLELNLPWPAPWEISQWRLDLAGLAVGYQGSGVSLAGALLKTAGATRGDPPSYLGTVAISAAGFGVNAFGGFGVYPVPRSSDTYVSLFVVAALHAPLGGVPAFFVTGVGGGVGINRALVLPTDVAALPRFPLVQALDPSSTIAADPMGALQQMGHAFPPQRGAIWFAAGVSFTSFSIVEGVALVSVSVGDGVEIALLGLARLGLPNPRQSIAQIELALIARFSTREMVLWIQAQLTDNSWVISPDARLTGGFAFVTWFRTGDFVVTLGGYHPNFKVARYPQVPRLGLSWTLGEFLSIRGATYFALCSTAVMVGARIDVSFRAGPAYARVIAGFDALVRFDPLYFEIDVYASVTGGIRIEIDLGWFGSIVIDLSISIGARLHIEGPEVHGTATLQMGPVEVPFRFGPQAPPERAALSWPAFFDKYLRPGGGQVLTVSVSGGAAATPGEPAESRNDGSNATAPWPVLPEFDLTAATTLAARSYAGTMVAGVGGLGVGPMGVAALASDWRVTVRAMGVAGAAGDHTARLTAEPRTQGVPPAVWRALPPGQASPALASGVDLVTACTGVDLRARARLVDVGGSASFDPYQVEEDRTLRKPLPFTGEQAARPKIRPAAGEAVRADTSTTPQRELASTVIEWLTLGPDVARATRDHPGPAPQLLGPLAAADAGEAERVRLLRRRVRNWQAVPRPVRITEGLGPALELPVVLTQRPAPPPDSGVDVHVGRPAILALLDTGVTAGHSGGRTTVTKLRGAAAEAAATLPRRAAPSADLGQLADRAVPARLLVAPGRLERSGSTVRPADGGVRTNQAGGPGELRRAPAVDPQVRRRLRDAAAQLSDDSGLTVVPGQALVLGLPNPHDDAAPQRPVLRVAASTAGSGAVRVVALDMTARALCDTTLAAGEVEVPPGTATLAVLGVGVGQPSAAGLAGWAAAGPAVQVAPGAALVPGAILRGPATSGREAVGDRSARGAAIVRAGDLVRGTGVVETVLPADSRTLLIALDRISGDTVDGLVLGLAGLRRRTGPDGVLAPVPVVQGRRTVLLYPVEADPDALVRVQDAAAAAGRTRPAETATVSIASDARWEVAAVVGGTDSADLIARDVIDSGVEGLVAPLVGGSIGSATVRWIHEESS